MKKNSGSGYIPEHVRLGVEPMPFEKLSSEMMVPFAIPALPKESEEDIIDDSFVFDDVSDSDDGNYDVELDDINDPNSMEFVEETSDETEDEVETPLKEPLLKLEDGIQSIISQPNGSFLLFVDSELMLIETKVDKIESAIDYICEKYKCPLDRISVLYKMEIKKGITLL